MARKNRSISLPESLNRELDKFLGGASFNAFAVQAIRSAMHKPVEADLSIKDKAERVESEAKMNKILDDGLIKAFQDKTAQGENPFAELTSVEIAKLMAQRSPKDKNMDEELEADFLSLSNILKRLPSIKDITAELNKTKGLNTKLRGELEVLEDIVKLQNRRLKKDFSGADEEIRSIIGKVRAISKDVKLEYDIRGMIYQGLLNGD